jgi:hypothetical protein
VATGATTDSDTPTANRTEHGEGANVHLMTTYEIARPHCPQHPDIAELSCASSIFGRPRKVGHVLSLAAKATAVRSSPDYASRRRHWLRWC